jgi:hypothetical protein
MLGQGGYRTDMAAPDPTPEARRRHCWVMEADHQRGPFPGLILEWRQLPSEQWQARVVYIPNLREGVAVQDWFAQARLRPVGDL